jgi:hypothetical protein
MPASRVEEKYLADLIHGIHYSATILASFRQLLPPPPSRSERVLKWYEGWHVEPRVRKFDQIERDARDAARRALASFHMASKNGST